MDEAFVELLQCPACGGALEWTVLGREGDRIAEATATCAGCDAEYSVQRGVAILLPPEHAQVDLWQDTEDWLAAHLRERPEVARALLEPDPSELAPADLFYRALALERRGDFAAARRVAELADERLYTEDTRACRDRQLDALVAATAEDDPVVDLASGRGALVERLAARDDRRVLATDVSPQVLLRTGAALDALGLAGRVSLLACDARRTPFRDRAVATLTTHLGLANVADPGQLLAELRRVVSGRMLALTPFYTRDDEANGAAIATLGLERLLYRDALLSELAAAGWSARVASSCRALALPTPVGVVLEGAAIDGLPVVETELEWALVEASSSAQDRNPRAGIPVARKSKGPEARPLSRPRCRWAFASSL